MAEKQFKYTAKFKSPQSVAGVKLDPRGGVLSERDYKTVQRNVYGASLIKENLLVLDEILTAKPAPPAPALTPERAGKENQKSDSRN